MGLVKISEQMHANIRSASAALSRSINAQAEHWMRVGMLAELNPGLNYSDICQLLIRAEVAGDTLSDQPEEFDTQETHFRAVSQ
ncbi:ParD-like family protein [Pseudomonas sp. LP_7_YM]|uniref:ParD-like family protein n=1 Tax=Pseudomonas sp. LP_7_YM TaxID=2485137 RepID=UPI00105C5E41|nr:ParD-like family protein [Pseudomonas sp. LP_7_YM]TDV67706.1 ParD-like antitoxin of type II ParDE toxin-antitoxin system [Pseudomonas sp. LP_7_YM]